MTAFDDYDRMLGPLFPGKRIHVCSEGHAFVFVVEKIEAQADGVTLVGRRAAPQPVAEPKPKKPARKK